jgi:hypothetical protein
MAEVVPADDGTEYRVAGLAEPITCRSGSGAWLAPYCDGGRTWVQYRAQRVALHPRSEVTRRWHPFRGRVVVHTADSVLEISYRTGVRVRVALLVGWTVLEPGRALTHVGLRRE